MSPSGAPAGMNLVLRACAPLLSKAAVSIAGREEGVTVVFMFDTAIVLAEILTQSARRQMALGLISCLIRHSTRRNCN